MKVTCVKCPSCGANLNIEDNVKKTKCQYCNTNIMIEKDLNDEIKANILDSTNKVKVMFPIIFIVFCFIFITAITSFIFTAVRITSSRSTFSVSSFNSPFTYSNGTQSGIFVANILDKAIDSNKKNSDHQIYIKYNDLKTNKENEIINIKDELERYSKYEVSIDYDNDGYVNYIKIIKK